MNDQITPPESAKPLPDPKRMDDDTLASEFMHWFRVYRNEGELAPNERAHFRELTGEMRGRGPMT